METEKYEIKCGCRLDYCCADCMTITAQDVSEIVSCVRVLKNLHTKCAKNGSEVEAQQLAQLVDALRRVALDYLPD